MDNLPMKIMYFALLAMAGWVYFYICVRQLVFDFTVGYRLIKVFDGVKEDVFAAQGARRLNTISVIMWAIICAGFLWLVIHFAATYLIMASPWARLAHWPCIRSAWGRARAITSRPSAAPTAASARTTTCARRWPPATCRKCTPR